jgi:transcriptional regulator with XRE-family HTH domain
LVPRSSPTARRRRLATALRQLREEHNLSCTDAGKAVGWSESKVSRIETGRVKIAQPDLERLLDLYEVIGETRAGLLTLARQATHRGWWRSYSDALPAWFENYVGLENGAKSLFTYQNQLVHGLMQTEEYAEAVIRAGTAASKRRRSGTRDWRPGYSPSSADRLNSAAGLGSAG